MPGFPTPAFTPTLLAGGEAAVAAAGAEPGRTTMTGGGGGGGGVAAAQSRSPRARKLHHGRIGANGGDGGDGAFPFVVGNPPSAPPFHAGCGGGGGGGAGGAIGLHGVRLLNGEVLAVGGTDGRAARFADAVITTPDTRTPLQKLLANPQSGLVQIDGAANAPATIAPGAHALPDLDYRQPRRQRAAGGDNGRHGGQIVSRTAPASASTTRWVHRFR
jgi:hypothetical protein